MGRKPTKKSAITPEKKNPLLELPVDQTWNTAGTIIWSNKIVTCPRCGKQSRLTLAASLREDWDLSLTCCPLPRPPKPATKKKGRSTGNTETAETSESGDNHSDATSNLPGVNSLSEEKPHRRVDPPHGGSAR